MLRDHEASTRHRTIFVVACLLQFCASVNNKWAVCENRAYRDDDIAPGGLRLLGVTESPLGFFPTAPAAATHEHFFQQLRDVWSDDCPRIMVEVGLQPAAGVLQNWTSTAIWLHYFNHSGIVMAVDPIDDYLKHLEDSLHTGPYTTLVTGDRVQQLSVHASIAATGRAKSKPRPVSFDSAGGHKVLASDEVMKRCASNSASYFETDQRHPCARILKRMSQPRPLEYAAPIRSFDEVWRDSLQSRHIDFLSIDLGAADMGSLMQKSFEEVFTERAVSIFAFRIDAFWTKQELKNIVEWMDRFEYFSVIKLLCTGSSQVGSFRYGGPSDSGVGPTTYLPLSGIDLENTFDWNQIPLPQDVLVLDLKQPDIFKTVQLGDAQCDADDAAQQSCRKEDGGKCSGDQIGDQAPERPQQLAAIRSESRSVTVEWKSHPEGPPPDTYIVRSDPGAREESVEHNAFDALARVHMHKIDGLQPDSEYSISVWAVGVAGRSSAASIVHRTEREAAPNGGPPYEIADQLHCGMSTSEEVQPAGPPPQGVSFFRDVVDVDGCRMRCDDSRQCVAFQTKAGEACWLYRRRPPEGRFAGPRMDFGWSCGIRVGGL